ncbi:MAG: COX15/CtaA family protein [Polyangiaceae bacterium]
MSFWNRSLVKPPATPLKTGTGSAMSSSVNTSGVPVLSSRLSRLAWAVLAANLVVIVWGAYVRASGSGAGCGSHWPLCNGVVIPRAPALTTLVELSHRLTSGLALVAVVALAIATFRKLPKGAPARTTAAWSVVFMFGEALIGAALVLFEHVAQNLSAKRALSMTLHLTNTFFLLAALTLTALHLSGDSASRPRDRSRSTLPFLGLFVLLVVVGTSGGIAALGDTLFPVRSLAEGLEMDRSATAHLFVRLRVFHPFLAVLGAFATLGYVTFVTLTESRPGVRKAARRLAILVVLQVALGVANLALLAPIPMQLVHLLVADGVWIALVVLAARSLAEADSPTARPAFEVADSALAG